MGPLDAKIESMPWPGEELVHRVTNQTDRRLFLESGHRSVQDLEMMLALAGRRLGDFKRILDFGCGCSRTLLWMEDIGRESELFGCDIDERMIRWGQQNVPWASFKVNDPLPPLDYPDAYFDLIYASSVFTHLDENYQDRWLAELRRITKPGGMLLLSVHGEWVLDPFEKAEAEAGSPLRDIRAELSEKGICFLEQDCFVGGPFPSFYHSTFHAPWYIFEHWGQYFYVRAYVSRGSVDYQDYVLLERRPDDAHLKPIQVRKAYQPSTEASGSVEQQVTSADASPAARGIDWRRRLESVLRRVARKVLGPATEARVQPQQSEQIAGGLPVTVLIDRMGERLNRLEADLWQTLERQEERLDRLEGVEGGSEPSTPA